MAGVIASVRPLLFDIDQATRSGFCLHATNCEAVSDIATTTVSGGTPPYTYLWELVSGDSFTIDNSTSSSTAWRKTNSTAGSPAFEGTYKCTVTDANLESVEAVTQCIVTLTFVQL